MTEEQVLNSQYQEAKALPTNTSEEKEVRRYAMLDAIGEMVEQIHINTKPQALRL